MIDPFWLYLACFGLVLAALPAAEWCDGRRWPAAAKCCLGIMVIASGIIFGKGASMIAGWENPFAGKASEVARAVHSAKGAMAIGLLSIWPYVLVALGAFFGIGGLTLLKRRL